MPSSRSPGPLDSTDDSDFVRFLGDRGRREDDSLDLRLAMITTGRALGSTIEPATLARFSVMRSLGRGGQGCVYEGWDPVLDRAVALKISRRRHDGASDDLRFEARALAQVDHPNIVTVYGLEICEGRPVVVMALVVGTPLLAWVTKQHPPVLAIVEVVAKIADGLGQLHARGLSHRDVKPTNILVDASGTPRLVDLGLAAYAGDKGGLGTPSFAAPEQLRGAAADPAADQYGLAATLRAALTASIGARARDDARVIERRILTAIERALADDPRARYPDIAAFARALRRTDRRRLGAIAVTVGGVALLGAAPALADAPCGRDARSIQSGAWSPAVRAQLAAHFEAIPHEVGRESFAVASLALDDYAVRWAESVSAVCASPAGPRWDGPRAQCLDDGAHELEVVTHELAMLDEHTASVAALLARDLPSPEQCSDAQAGSLAPLVSHADEIAVRRSISITRRRCQYGLTKDCAADYDRIGDTARAQGLDACSYEPSILLERGVDALHGGDDSGKDVELLEQATLAADRCGLDAVKLDAERTLADRFARRGDTEAARVHMRGAEATLDRLGRPRSDEIGLLATEAIVLLAGGAPRESADAAARALALHRDVGYGSAGERAQLLGIQSSALFELGDTERAIELQTRALEIRKDELGPRHPMVAFELANLSVSTAAVDPARSRALNREAIDIFMIHADGHELSLAICLTHEAESAIAEGEISIAKTANDRALELFATFGHDQLPYTADALVNRSWIRMAMADLDGAQQDARAAHALLVTTRGATDATTLDALVQLAATLRAQGDHAAAQTMACEANAGFIAAYGADHPLAGQFARHCSTPGS